MQFQLNGASRYVVQVSRRGPPAKPFGWEICREDDSVETHRSAQTFATRLEALLDSVRTAAALTLVLIVEPSWADGQSSETDGHS
jgi:hypothetical protein